MSVADRLASALERNDERPNVALAEALAAAPDTEAVAELVALLTAGDKAQRHDAIKVLYELGERDPEQIAPHFEVFISLLTTRDNRMRWGVMSALAALAPIRQMQIFAHLDAILAAADAGSVIARDKAMKLLADLNAVPELSRQVTPILFARLRTSAVNQVPMYAEYAAPTIAESDKRGLHRDPCRMAREDSDAGQAEAAGQGAETPRLRPSPIRLRPRPRALPCRRRNSRNDGRSRARAHGR